jgi:hypothetical protein
MRAMHAGADPETTSEIGSKMPDNSTSSEPHSDPQRLNPKSLARSRREAMRLRTRKIRRSVAGLALSLFTAAFLAVYVQLASGHDPALTANAERRNVSTSLVASTSSTTAANAEQKAAAAKASAAKKAAAELAAAEKATQEAAASNETPSAETGEASSTTSTTESNSSSSSGESSGTSAVTTSQS